MTGGVIKLTSQKNLLCSALDVPTRIQSREALFAKVVIMIVLRRGETDKESMLQIAVRNPNVLRKPDPTPPAESIKEAEM